MSYQRSPFVCKFISKRVVFALLQKRGPTGRMEAGCGWSLGFSSGANCWYLIQFFFKDEKNTRLKKKKKKNYRKTSYGPKKHFYQLDSTPSALTYVLLTKAKWVKLPSHVWLLFETPWTVARQAPLSMGFFSQEYWSELPFPSSRYLPDPEIKPGSLTLKADALPSEPPGKLWPKQTQVLIRQIQVRLSEKCWRARKWQEVMGVWRRRNGHWNWTMLLHNSALDSLSPSSLHGYRLLWK